MPKIIMERLRQKYRTMSYPDGPAPELPERWPGEPIINADAFIADQQADYCPVGAIDLSNGAKLDLGKCIFCTACQNNAPSGAVTFSRKFAMSRFNRGDLILDGEDKAANPDKIKRLQQIRSLFGRSLKLRQVSAGGCNACEADSNVLGTLAWDMGRFGISFVASPRHADGVLVTGPISDNMLLALEKTYAAVPAPKVVIAVGACAISGGIYAGGNRQGRLDSMLPVDLYIPGCPPHPLVILEGLLRLIGRIS